MSQKFDFISCSNHLWIEFSVSKAAIYPYVVWFLSIEIILRWKYHKFWKNNKTNFLMGHFSRPYGKLGCVFLNKTLVGWTSSFLLLVSNFDWSLVWQKNVKKKRTFNPSRYLVDILKTYSISIRSSSVQNYIL